MLINDVGHFYRPRFAPPEMTEQEYMGPYYGMNDDELQSYSTQIVPPQDLFGLGQEDPHIMPMSKVYLLFGAGAAFGFIVGFVARKFVKI